MSKAASLFFALTSAVWMIATAISLSHNVWLALLFFVLTFLTIGLGFIWKARSRRQKGSARS